MQLAGPTPSSRAEPQGKSPWVGAHLHSLGPGRSYRQATTVRVRYLARASVTRDCGATQGRPLVGGGWSARTARLIAVSGPRGRARCIASRLVVKVTHVVSPPDGWGLRPMRGALFSPADAGAHGSSNEGHTTRVRCAKRAGAIPSRSFGLQVAARTPGQATGSSPARLTAGLGWIHCANARNLDPGVARLR